ncbi:MAG TPA: Gfo/Idh/MocA family oxidoreductase [Terracidiphilus sp.]|jgi:predicted dehydrogenase|nr:Gfo/Idh/MocA family oxidoreductase [Terracidiphilus sp.]
MNRREFLYTGVAAAASSSHSLDARAYASIAGANDRVGLGVIGTGRRATQVCGGFVQDPRVQIRALADIYDKQVATFQSRFKEDVAQATVAVEYQSMLDRKDVDAVLIATPDHLHVQIAKNTLAANKNTYLEKPTLHRWHERETLIHAAAASKSVLQCGMQQRSGAHYMRAKHEIFDAGLLGDVVIVRAVWSNFSWQRRVIPSEPKPPELRWDLFLGPAPKVPYETSRYSSWRSYHDYGNGLLADILTHWADVAQWMLGDDQPASAAALGGDFKLRGDLTNPDTVSAIVKYRNWNLNFESSVLSIRDQNPSVYFEGTKGTLDLSRKGYVFTPNDGAPVQVDSVQSLERAHTGNFLDAVIKGDKVNAPLEAGLAASVPVMLSLQSYWTQKISTPSELV